MRKTCNVNAQIVTDVQRWHSTTAQEALHLLLTLTPGVQVPRGGAPLTDRSKQKRAPGVQIETAATGGGGTGVCGTSVIHRGQFSLDPVICNHATLSS